MIGSWWYDQHVSFSLTLTHTYVNAQAFGRTVALLFASFLAQSNILHAAVSPKETYLRLNIMFFCHK